MANEILTLQFGHYSNYVGTHWWNLQEKGFQYDPNHPSEINHDTLYRQGVNFNKQITFTPRLLLVDLKGSLLTLSESGDLYTTPDDTPIDTTLYEVQQSEKPPKIPFQQDLNEATCSSNIKKPQKIYDLDRDVRVWSDFLYSRYHPRTINTIKPYEHENKLTPFDVFPLGSEIWKTPQFCDDFTDKIRNYIEECDHFTGFQVLFDAVDAFAGLTVSCLEHINDEYSNKSILTFPTIPYSDSIEKASIQMINYILALDGIREYANLSIPLSTLGPRHFPNITYNPISPYQSSAILATYLETVTIAYRLKNTILDLYDFNNSLSVYGRKIGAASLHLPFPINDYFIKILDEWNGPLSVSLTPNCEIDTDNNFQHFSLRGIGENMLKSKSDQKQREMPAYKCETIEEMMKMFVDYTCYRSKTRITACGEKINVTTPFPDNIIKKYEENGCVAALAGAHNGKFVGDMLENIVERIEKIQFKRFNGQFKGLETDDFAECVERVRELSDCYTDSMFL